jgi:hypothetical protein
MRERPKLTPTEQYAYKLGVHDGREMARPPWWEFVFYGALGALAYHLAGWALL